MIAIDLIALSRELAALLQAMDPFDATCAAAAVAFDPDAYRRHALAAALVSPFPLVGDDFIIDVLSRDPDLGVRMAATRAEHARGALLSPRSCPHL